MMPFRTSATTVALFVLSSGPVAGQIIQAGRPLSVPDTTRGSCRIFPAELLPDSVRIFRWSADDRHVEIRHTPLGVLLEYSDAWYRDSRVERVRVERTAGALKVKKVTSAAWQLSDSTIVTRASSVATILLKECVGIEMPPRQQPL